MKFQQHLFAKTTYYLFEGYFAWRLLSYALYGPKAVSQGGLIVLMYIVSWVLRFSSQTMQINRLYNMLGSVLLLAVVAWVYACPK